MEASDREIFARATFFYVRWLKASGFDEREIKLPGRSASRLEGDIFILGNVRSELARYRVRGEHGRERLRRIEPRIAHGSRAVRSPG